MTLVNTMTDTQMDRQGVVINLATPEQIVDYLALTETALTTFLVCQK